MPVESDKRRTERKKKTDHYFIGRNEMIEEGTEDSSVFGVTVPF